MRSVAGAARRPTRTIGALLGCWTLLELAAAGAGPLQLEVRPLATPPRPAGPEWIEARLTSSATHLLEGVLELNVIDEGASTVITRTQELALTTGPRVFRLLLPMPANASFGLTRTLRARFLTQSGALDLGDFPVHTRGRSAHTFVLAIGRTNLRVDEDGTRLWQSLRPERFAPKTTPAPLETVATTPVFLEPDDFPTEPLAYCVFDTVMLEPGVFGRLKEKSAVALGQWLEAGGNVALVVPGQLEMERAELLRRWLASDPATRRFEFQFDPDGRLQAASDDLIRARIGLGRLVVFPRLPETPHANNTSEWLGAAAFLWKLRPDFADAIEDETPWTPPDRRTFRNETHERSQLATELTQILLPKTVRVIPLPMIIAILAAFILVVGPLDYLLLGKLRLRKFTWIVFPLVSVGFTVLTMKLAGHYLGTNTHHGVLILTDLGLDGRTLRQTRFELTLPPRPQTLVRETQHAFVSPMSASDPAHESRTAPPTLDGQFPARYTCFFPGQQWTPHLRRVLSLGGAADDSQVQWSAFAGPQHEFDFAVDGMRGGSGCTFAVVHAGQVRVDRAGPLPSAFLSQITFPAMHLSHPMIARLSPGSAGSFDDLAILDREGPGTVVIAIRQAGADIYAWRKLYQ